MTDDGGPFKRGDVVETIKGARFWGEVVSVYCIDREIQVIGAARVPVISAGQEWRVDVRAIAPDFLGTIHVYPAQQLRRRANAALKQTEAGHD